MLVYGLVANDLMGIRSSINNYTDEDRDLKMLFKAVYLLGAKECEMLGERYDSEPETHVYGPTGDDSWEEPVLVNNNPINTVFFRIRTARMKGKEERIVWLPKDFEPWAKELLDYFKEKGGNGKKVFPFNRVEIRDRVIKSKVLEGLKKPVTYTGETTWKDWGLDELREVRKKELEDKYLFKDAHLKVYGIRKINKKKAPDNLLDDPRIDELKKEYLWNLCNPKTEEKNSNILFADGMRVDTDELIEKGENENIEFKSSLCWDFDKKNKYWVPEMAVAKAVASFLNSDGGFLLIGVKDDKTLLGLEADFKAIKKSSEDAFDLHFTNVIGNYLGIENRRYVTIRFTEKQGKKIALVVIPKKAPTEVFLTVDHELYFYIRSGNSSRFLNMKDTIEYIRQHWKWQNTE
jgi:hypothetical protein